MQNGNPPLSRPLAGRSFVDRVDLDTLAIEFRTFFREGRAGEVAPRRAALVRDGLAEEVSAYEMCRALSRLNRAVILAALELHLERHPWLAECTFLEFGSGGRGEQVLGSDQDNGLLLRGEIDPDELDEAAQSVVLALAAAGLPLCRGGVMLSSPDWRGDFDVWLERLTRWLSNPAEFGPWQSGLILDFVPVRGPRAEALVLRERLWEYVRTKPLVLKFLVDELGRTRLPLTLFGAFITEKDGPHARGLDLKGSVLAHLTNGARILALKYGLPPTSTYERVAALTEAGHLRGAHGAELLEAWELLQGWRLRIGLECLETGAGPHGFVRPADLSRDDRRRLKTAVLAVERLVRLVLAGAGL